MSAFKWLGKLTVSRTIVRWLQGARRTEGARSPDPSPRPESPPARPARGPASGKSHVAFNIPASSWPNLGKPIDPNLRLAVSLVGWGDSVQLFQKTGVQIVDEAHPAVGRQYLPLILK